MGRLGYFGDAKVERLKGEVVVRSPVSWAHVIGCRKTESALEAPFAGVAWINARNPIPTEDSDPEPDVIVYPAGSRTTPTTRRPPC